MCNFAAVYIIESMKPNIYTTFIAATLCVISSSCDNENQSVNNNEYVWDSSSSDQSTGERGEYSDMKMFELKGPVKECRKETFYDITVAEEDNSKVTVDSAADKRPTSTLYFDKLGNYVPSASERVDRDDKGRIIYWRDSRPNAKGVDPGMLRDTLRYTHVNNNVLQSKGMGEFAVTVYDNDNRIIGQYSNPDVNGTQMAAFNIYRTFDERGNWTERITVWTTQSAGGRPHVSYTLDSRQISYY